MILWMKDAACKGQELWMFPHDADEEGIAHAKSFCDVCPVREQCLSYALSIREKHGVWGGTTAEERVTILRRKARWAAIDRKVAAMEASIGEAESQMGETEAESQVGETEDAPKS